MEKREREYILENQFHWEDRRMVAQLWNIAFCFSNDLFPHWLYLGQNKRFRHHSEVHMIAYGFLLREEWKICLLLVRKSGNDRLGSLEKEVLSTSILWVSQVTVLILLFVTFSSSRQACLSHMCTTFIDWSQRGTLMWAVDLLSYLMTAPVEQTIVSVQDSWINKFPAALL